MAKFSFKQDLKQTCWYRAYFEVEAETEEKAIEFVKNNFSDKNVIDYCEENEEESKVEFTEGEMLVDTGEYMSVEQNGGFSTIEVLYDVETICANGK